MAGLHWGRWEVAEGLQSSHRAPMAVCGRWAGQDGGERTQQETLAPGGASLRGRWGTGGRALSGREWNGSQPGQGAAELLLPRPAPGKMQGQPACRAGEPSGQGEDPSSEGLGGHDLLTQADAGCPAGQVVRHRLNVKGAGMLGHQGGAKVYHLVVSHVRNRRDRGGVIWFGHPES